MQKLSFQKHPIHNLFTTILLLGGGLFAAAGLTSCDNFLNGGDVKQEIEDAIAYNNAKEITVLVQPEEGTGSTVPSGNHKAKQGYDFEVSFSENPAYSFVKWIAVSKDKPQEIITGGISFEDDTAPKTKVKVSSDSTSIRLIPLCEQRIAVSGEPSPRYDPLGVSRDRSISVSFTKALAESSFIFAENEIPEGASVKKDESGKIWAYTLNSETFLKNISITNIDDYSIAEYFTKPEVNGKLLTIAVDKNNPIEFNAGEIFKTVKVTLSKDIEDSGHIKMNSQKSWNYQITEATDEKATVILTSTEAEGSVYLASTKSYSLGQKITLAFTENADYQFVRWDYDSSIIYIEDPKSLNTVAVVREKTTEESPTQIKAVCAPRLRVTKLLPENDNANPTVSKNSPILITFNHEIPADESSLAQLENITISVGGAPVKSSFKSPVINGNTITFDADNYNMLEVPAGQTKTVSVSIPADFYYQLEDGTKVTYGGNGRTFDYKIDDSTKQKAAITFTSTGESGAITPAAGLGRYSIGQEIPLKFTLASGWKFNCWSITKSGNPVLDSEIKIADKNSPNTKLTVYQALEGVTVKADASQLLNVTSTSPSSEVNSKDSAITILFNKDLADACKNILDQIKITMDGVNVDSYFATRKLNGNKITITNTKYLNVTGSETKTITVTVPTSFFYIDSTNNVKVYLSQEKTFTYVVNSTTGDKTSIAYEVSTANSGTINQGTAKDYDIGSTVNLAFNLADGYQFNGWQITDENGENVDESIIKIADTKALATTMKIYQYARGISVKANTSQILKVSTYAPTASSNSKDTSISIIFNKNLYFASQAEKDSLLNSIRVTVDGNSVDNNFSTRTVNAATISLDNTKYLSVADGLQKTVTVTIPSTFYYMDGSAKVNLAQDYSFNYVVNSASIAQASINFSVSNNSGNITPAAGSVSYSLDKEIPLSFVPSDGYEFTGWTVTYSDGTEVEASKIKIDDPSKKSTKLYIYESVSNVTIKANAYLVPSVVSTSPEYQGSGVECDSNIVITFNKAINNTNAITLANNGIIQIVDASNEYEHYESHFKTPVWSDGNKRVSITPKNTIRNILSNENDLKNLRVRVNYSAIKDAEGHSVQGQSDSSWIYRINHEMEKIAPTVEMKLYKRGFDIEEQSVTDSNNPDYPRKYYAMENNSFTELSNAVFNKTNGFSASANYPLNHVGTKVYFDALVSDEGSGYKHLTINEKQIKTADGNDANGAKTYTKTIELDEDSFDNAIAIFDEQGNINLHAYTLQTAMDGVIQLDFIFEDYAGSKATRTWYVIKDTTINITEVLNPKSATFADKISTNGKIIEKFDYSACKDTYYSGYSTECTYYLWSGTAENNAVFKGNNKIITFERNVSDYCYVWITACDSLGNIKTIKRLIPKQFELGEIYLIGTSYMYSFIGVNELEEKQKKLGAVSTVSGCVSICRKNDVYDESNLSNPIPQGYFVQFSEDGRYKIYFTVGLQWGESYYYWAPMYGPYYIDYPINITDSQAPDFPDTFSFTPDLPLEKNTGFVQMHTIFPENFTKTVGYEYGVYWNYDYNVRYEKLDFKVKSWLSSMPVYLFAKNINSGKIYKSENSVSINTCGANYDNIPPNCSGLETYYCSWPNMINNIYIAEYEDDLYKNSDGQYEMEYYLIKKDNTSMRFDSICLEDLQLLQNEKILCPYYASSRTGTRILLNEVPFIESYYDLIINARDNKENCKIYQGVYSNITSPEFPKLLSCVKDQEVATKTCITSCIKTIKEYGSYGISSFCNLTNNNVWTVVGGTTQKSDNNYTTSINSCPSGFLMIRYKGYKNGNAPFVSSLYNFLCPEYETKTKQEKDQLCKTKAVITGLGDGFVVYYDAPCFAHTMAFPTNMLSDLNAKLAEAKSIDSSVDDETYIKAIWETKGREYGLKLINSAWLDSASTATYTAPVNEIPSGFSYVTVFHFADGTSVMSEVKQK